MSRGRRSCSGKRRASFKFKFKFKSKSKSKSKSCNPDLHNEPTIHDSRLTIHPFMAEALALASEASAAGDVPVGAIVVRNDQIIGRGANRTVRDQDATAHAEILAIREAASALGSWRLEGCELFVTLEPCAMCAGAIVLARLDRVTFGAWDEKAGMAGSVGDLLRHPRLNHRPEVASGVMAPECGQILREFFAGRR